MCLVCASSAVSLSAGACNITQLVSQSTAHCDKSAGAKSTYHIKPPPSQSAGYIQLYFTKHVVAIRNGNVLPFVCSFVCPFVRCHHSPASITPSLEAQNQPFQQILPTLTFLLYYACDSPNRPTYVVFFIYLLSHWTVFMVMALDRTYHAHQFIFSFYFTFFVRSVW